MPHVRLRNQRILSTSSLPGIRRQPLRADVSAMPPRFTAQLLQFCFSNPCHGHFSSPTALWLPYAFVVFAVMSMAWAGPLYVTLQPSPPFLCAAWRLTLTSVLMVPGVIWDVLHASPTLMQAWLKVQPLLIVTGVVLAFHFCTFSWSVAHTSFSHAMIIVSITPMLLVLWAVCLWVLGAVVVWQCGVVFTRIATTVRRPSAGNPLALSVPEAHSYATRQPAQLAAHDGNDKIPILPLELEISMYDMNPVLHPVVAIDTLTPDVSCEETQAAVAERTEAFASSSNIRFSNHTTNATIASPSFAARHKQNECAEVQAPVASNNDDITATAQSLAPTHASPVQSRVLGAFVFITGTTTQPLLPSFYELGGSVLAFCGVVLLILLRDGASSSPVTLAGDAAAVLSALSMVFYLIIGGRLRQWLPIWMYTFPLTLSAGIVACGVSLAAEEQVTFAGLTEHSLFGWLGNPRLFGLTFAAAFVPGILGHTLANYSLQRVNPLVLSVTQLVQPGISMLYGYAIGVQDKPNAGTFIGAPVIICGVAAVLLGSRRGQLWVASVVSGLWPRQWCGMR